MSDNTKLLTIDARIVIAIPPPRQISKEGVVSRDWSKYKAEVIK